MKAIKMVGLAALMALTAMALIGTSSAMAESTSLCSADESICAAGFQLGSVHETSVGRAKLLTSVGSVTCDVLFSGTIATKLANPLVISGNFTWTNCELGGQKCTSEQEFGSAEIKVLKEGHETAKVTGEYLVHVICSGFIDCLYNATNLKFTAKGPLLSAQIPDNGEVSLSEQTLNKVFGAILCPKSAKLDITMSPLSATYISS